MSVTPLNDPQLLRYSRHIMLPAMDIDGQEKLWNSKVLIIGVGGLGCAVSQYLTASGTGQLTLVDDDKVDSTNLQRQVLHHQDAIGSDKVVSAKRQLNALNDEVEVHCINRRLNQLELDEQVSKHDLVIDCCDNLETRNALNQACFTHKVPLVSGAAIRMEGQVICFDMQADKPCYQCLSQMFGEQQLSCSESGILSPVVGIVGSLQATEAIKILAGIGKPLYGQLLMLDAASMEINKFILPKNPSCKVCS